MMKKQGIFTFITLLIALFLISCENDSHIPNVVETSTKALVSTNTPLPTATFTHTPTKTATPSPTNTEIPSKTPTPTIPPETRLQVQCLEVLLAIPTGAISDGIVVLGSRSGNQVRGYDTYLLDMTTGQTTTISVPNETQLKHVVSLDRNLIAYSRFTSDNDGHRIKQLIIATADGHIQKEISWEDKWAYILRWTHDQRILLTYDDPDLRDRENWSAVYAYLVYDPFSGEQELLHPIFPGYLTNAMPPYWDGWFGAVYDPTLSRAVVPKVLSENEELYAFALWDVSAQELVSSLENIFVEPVVWSDVAPKPVWSEDGTHFAFVGHLFDDDPPEFELYQVSRDGQVEQLTHINSIARFREFPFEWSPDGRKIAILLDLHPEIDGENILVLDLETKEITDTCISASGNLSAFEPYPPLIWSPDGQKFLVKDWMDDSHSRIILVDIEQGFAAQIAEDVDLNGWMVSP